MEEVDNAFWTLVDKYPHFAGLERLFARLVDPKDVKDSDLLLIERLQNDVV